MRGHVAVALTLALALGCGPGSSTATKPERALTAGALYATQEGMPQGSVARYGSMTMRLPAQATRLAVSRADGRTATLVGGIVYVLEPSERVGVSDRWTITSNRGRLTWVSFLPSGLIAVGNNSSSRPIEIWSTETRERLSRISTRGRHQFLAAASPARDHVAYASTRDVVVHDVVEDAEVHRLRIGSLRPQSLHFTPDGNTLLLLHRNGYIAWDLSTDEATITTAHATGYAGWLQAASLSPDGERFAVGTLDGRVEIWSIREKVRERQLAQREGERRGPVRQIEWSQDGSIWLARHGKNDSLVEVWSEDGTKAEPSASTRGTGFSRDGEDAFVMSGNTIRQVKSSTLEPQGNSVGHDAPVRQLALGPDGALYSAASDGTLLRWDLDTKKGAPVKTRVSTTFPAFDWDGDTLAVATSGVDGAAIEVLRGDEVAFTLESDATFWRLALDAEAQELVGVDENGAIHTWDLERRARTSRVPLGSKNSRVKAASDDLETVVVDDPFGARARREASAVRAWSARGASLMASRPRPTSVVLRCAAASSRAACVVSGNAIEVFDGDETLHSIGHPYQRLSGIAFTSDEEGLIITGRPLRANASNRDSLRIVDMESGDVTHKLDALPGAVTSTMMHPDGRRLFLGFSDGLVYAFDLEKFAIFRSDEEVELP